MSLIRQFEIRNELLYSGFVLLNVQIFFVQKISFATFGVSIDDYFTRYAGLGYSLYGISWSYSLTLLSVRRLHLISHVTHIKHVFFHFVVHLFANIVLFIDNSILLVESYQH